MAPAGTSIRPEGTPPPPPDRAAHRTEVLASLTRDGQITAEQAEKLQTFLQEKAVQRHAEFEKIRSLSAEERQAYFQKKPPQHFDFIADIQKAAGLTPEQAKTVATALRPPAPPFNAQKTRGILSKMVHDNTLTAAQSEQVFTFLQKKSAEHKVMRDKIGKMTPEERQAFFQKSPPKRPDFLADLQSAAGLTKEQAKTVADAFHPPHHPLHPQQQINVQPAPTSNVPQQNNAEKVVSHE